MMTPRPAYADVNGETVPLEVVTLARLLARAERVDPLPKGILPKHLRQARAAYAAGWRSRRELGDSDAVESATHEEIAP